MKEDKTVQCQFMSFGNVKTYQIYWSWKNKEGHTIKWTVKTQILLTGVDKIVERVMLQCICSIK